MDTQQSNGNEQNAVFAVSLGGQVTHVFADARSAQTYAEDNAGTVIAFPVRTLDTARRMYDRHVVIVAGEITSDKMTASWYFEDTDAECLSPYVESFAHEDPARWYVMGCGSDPQRLEADMAPEIERARRDRGRISVTR